MVTGTLPAPAARDHLVARGSLYRLLEEAPPVQVRSVPEAAQLDIPFTAGVTLAGFEPGGDAIRGSVVQLTYYWRADRPLDDIPSAVTLFADARGRIASEGGWPLWQQSRRIAEEVVAPGDWPARTMVRESYFALVPRDLAPGTYDVRLTVFDGAAEPAGARQQAADGLVTVGQITVR
jgi:hypothetical protein